MEYADLVRRAAMIPPRKRWHLAGNVIAACRRFVRSLLHPQRCHPYLALDVRDDAPAAMVFTPDDDLFNGIVKERRCDDLRTLGGAPALVRGLASDGVDGIAGGDDDIRRRRELFGTNTFPRPKVKGFWRHVADALSDTFLIVLIVLAAVSLGFGIKEHGIKNGWYDGVSILVAVFLVCSVSAVSNHLQAKRFAKLAGESDNIKIAVVRGGRRQEVSIFDIVVGDIVLLNIGDQVPADGVLVQGHSLQVDESSMTGEPHPVDVDGDTNPFLASGTKVVDGYGRMVVTAVGTATTWGEMMGAVSRENADPTPLQERLEKLSSSIGRIGITVAAAVFAVLMARYFTGSTRNADGRPAFDRHHVTADAVVSALVDIFQKAVTIIVVAIPEGLPLAVTLTLAFSMKRMIKDNALVRRLSACETMGAVTVVCTDKTGTLTLNKMTVTQFWIGDDCVDAGSSIDGAVKQLLQHGVGMNTTGSVFRADRASPAEISGSPTEKALLRWAVEDLAVDIDELKRSFTVLHVEAFNSEKKRSGVLLRDNASGAVTAHWKGAAEMILARCASFVHIGGAPRRLDAAQRLRLGGIIEGMAAASLRCVAFACKAVGEDDPAVIDDEGLTLLGFVGIKDPCRPEVSAAIAACHGAGVAVKMVTGDNMFTARAIARECGIIGEDDDDDADDAVIEGEQFRALSPEEQINVADKIRVMARSSPLDKLLLVQSLKKKGHVVAVTGDGTNDAPALKEADVGLSMGIQGTEVAKESSDVVIMDDDFGTVVSAIRWGRCVYANIQKFIQFQLAVNAAALVINFVSAVTSGAVPLTTVQLLWVNLIMDSMGALALATDRPTPELMEKPPVGRTAPLISAAMWRNLLAQAAYQVAVLLVLQFDGRRILGGVGEGVSNTMIFNTFVLCQVFNEFNSRKIEERNVFAGVLANKLFVGIVAVTVAMQAVMVEVLTRFAGTERLTWAQWGVCVGIAAVSWPLGWIVKCVPAPALGFFGRRRRPEAAGGACGLQFRSC